MKILMITWELSPYHGWGTATLNTVHGLTQKGHAVETLVFRRMGNQDVTQHAVLPDIRSMLYNPLLWPLTAWKILAAVRRFKPDIIHVYGEPYMLALPLIPTKLLPPWVFTACGTYAILPLHMALTRSQMLRCYRHAAATIAISRYTAKRIDDELAAAKEEDARKKVHVVTLGIRPPDKTAKREASGTKQILFIGGVKARKGVREVVEACGAYRKIGTLPFTLDIVGSAHDEAYVKEIKQRIEELGMKDCVRIRGQISEEALEQAYANADLFMMLSKSDGHHFEGFGLVFLEANIRGVPVIGPFDSGCEDAISDGVSGYLVHPEDSAQAAKRIKSILEESAISPNSCKAWAAAQSIQKQADETEAIYRQLLGL
jgi:phosphatidyl-myo-inositol dimannoside synthase